MVSPISSASISSIPPVAPNAVVSQVGTQSPVATSPAPDTVSISPQAHALHDGDGDGH